MINPATRSYDAFNEFTDLVRNNSTLLVKLRDGTIVSPKIFLGEDDWCDDYNLPRGFNTADWKYVWHLDGTSVTRYDYDMMEIVKKD